MRYHALVPVKSLDEVKSRLATHLTLQQRRTLVLDMLHHVLQALHQSELLDQISVVSPDERVLQQTQLWGVQALVEERPGHNEALYAAALREQRTDITGLLTISADLPLLHPNDIRALIGQPEHYAVVLASSRDRTGTNAILMRPPLVLPYLFGPNSLQRYQQMARNMEVSSIVYSNMGLALDVDTVDDLDDVNELQILSGGQSQSWQLASCGSPI
ncbi:MAG TPA: 2-phospho-L-lactate guanylyltransferase [Ktedonobacteraceae bacterium]|nr:2-phospho-L-lactate guanylyltransferase [Ktedonobacteraceae bacterium]